MTPHAAKRICPVPVIGAVGGVGSGKSTLVRWVTERHPVAQIDADQLGHQVLTYPHIQQALAEAFGPEVLHSDGTAVQVDRRALAQRVFGDDASQRAARGMLERIVHPEIRKLMEERLSAIDPTGTTGVLLDAAILLEAGWADVCDGIVFVETLESDRRSRVQQQRRWTPEELAAREASQWPLERKRAAASCMITNRGDVDEAGQALWDYVRNFPAITTE